MGTAYGFDFIFIGRASFELRAFYVVFVIQQDPRCEMHRGSLFHYYSLGKKVYTPSRLHGIMHTFLYKSGKIYVTKSSYRATDIAPPTATDIMPWLIYARNMHITTAIVPET